MDEHEYICRHDTVHRIDSLCEEIGSDNRIQIRVDKRAPRYRCLTGRSLGASGNAGLPQHGTYGRGSYLESELLELTDYAPVSPVGIALSDSLY